MCPRYQLATLRAICLANLSSDVQARSSLQNPASFSYPSLHFLPSPPAFLLRLPSFLPFLSFQLEWDRKPYLQLIRPSKLQKLHRNKTSVTSKLPPFSFLTSSWAAMGWDGKPLPRTNYLNWTKKVRYTTESPETCGAPGGPACRPGRRTLNWFGSTQSWIAMMAMVQSGQLAASCHGWVSCAWNKRNQRNVERKTAGPTRRSSGSPPPALLSTTYQPTISDPPTYLPTRISNSCLLIGWDPRVWVCIYRSTYRSTCGSQYRDRYATEVSSLGQREPVELSGMRGPYVVTFLFRTPIHSTLRNITPVATKVHMILRIFVMFTWMGDKREWIV
jgi:hypothetical protein